MSNRKDFLLSQLRVAAIKCKLIENEINSIGVALKADWIDEKCALQWVEDIGAIALVGDMPADAPRKAAA